jgi:hypothetical protein
MSSTHVDISFDLVDGIFDVLDGNVIYGGTTYPVYKSIPKTPESVYVTIGDVLSSEDGTKDDFVYYGTVQVIVVDESKQRADKKLVQDIMNVVRGLLKPAKATVFTCGSRNLVVFHPESSVPLVEQSDNGISRIRLIDIYNFIIE